MPSAQQLQLSRALPRERLSRVMLEFRARISTIPTAQIVKGAAWVIIPYFTPFAILRLAGFGVVIAKGSLGALGHRVASSQNSCLLEPRLRRSLPPWGYLVLLRWLPPLGFTKDFGGKIKIDFLSLSLCEALEWIALILYDPMYHNVQTWEIKAWNCWDRSMIYKSSWDLDAIRS
ncbi:hypothetical protein V5O48_007618 [Marasmius crinis-equi]|uniref:Uncharacterized protein n=1 Tax=Marasmius crinis-equi TaxID=585013 RepID=A0ABR3FGS3_9AGAR